MVEAVGEEAGGLDQGVVQGVTLVGNDKKIAEYYVKIIIHMIS